ncbi:MAG TPA: hypothetical protein VFH06_04535 [Candidatus Saccharimonadales bacterium]|nr:hypothetical protein [Candidatus Saccharimonadales bacterium]
MSIAEKRIIKAKRPYRLYFILGLLVPLPFIAASLLFDFFSQNIHASNAFLYLTIIILTILFFTILVVKFYRRLSDTINDLDIHSATLLGFHVSCLILLSPLLYAAVASLQPPLRQLFQALLLVCVSGVLMVLFLGIALSKLADTKNPELSSHYGDLPHRVTFLFT